MQFLVKRFIGLLFVVLGITFITFILGYLLADLLYRLVDPRIRIE